MDFIDSNRVGHNTHSKGRRLAAILSLILLLGTMLSGLSLSAFAAGPQNGSVSITDLYFVEDSGAVQSLDFGTITDSLFSRNIKVRLGWRVEITTVTGETFPVGSVEIKIPRPLSGLNPQSYALGQFEVYTSDSGFYYLRNTEALAAGANGTMEFSYTVGNVRNMPCDEDGIVKNENVYAMVTYQMDGGPQTALSPQPISLTLKKSPDILNVDKNLEENVDAPLVVFADDLGPAAETANHPENYYWATYSIINKQKNSRTRSYSGIITKDTLPAGAELVLVIDKNERKKIYQLDGPADANPGTVTTETTGGIQTFSIAYNQTVPTGNARVFGDYVVVVRFSKSLFTNGQTVTNKVEISGKLQGTTSTTLLSTKSYNANLREFSFPKTSGVLGVTKTGTDPNVFFSSNTLSVKDITFSYTINPRTTQVPQAESKIQIYDDYLCTVPSASRTLTILPKSTYYYKEILFNNLKAGVTMTLQIRRVGETTFSDVSPTSSDSTSKTYVFTDKNVAEFKVTLTVPAGTEINALTKECAIRATGAVKKGNQSYFTGKAILRNVVRTESINANGDVVPSSNGLAGYGEELADLAPRDLADYGQYFDRQFGDVTVSSSWYRIGFGLINEGGRGNPEFDQRIKPGYDADRELYYIDYTCVVDLRSGVVTTPRGGGRSPNATSSTGFLTGLPMKTFSIATQLQTGLFIDPTSLNVSTDGGKIPDYELILKAPTDTGQTDFNGHQRQGVIIKFKSNASDPLDYYDEQLITVRYRVVFDRDAYEFLRTSPVIYGNSQNGGTTDTSGVIKTTAVLVINEAAAPIASGLATKILNEVYDHESQDDSTDGLTDNGNFHIKSNRGDGGLDTSRFHPFWNDADRNGFSTERILTAGYYATTPLPIIPQSTSKPFDLKVGDSALPYSYSLSTSPGSIYSYKIIVKNESASPMTNVKVFDTLPFVGDVFLSSGLPRGSQWEGVYQSATARKISGGSSTALSPTIQFSTTPYATDVSSWGSTYTGGVTKTLQFDFGALSLATDEQIEIIINVKAPAGNEGKKSVNTAYYSYDTGATYHESNGAVVTLYAESTLTLRKEIEGTYAGANDTFNFTVTIADDAGAPLANHSYTYLGYGGASNGALALNNNGQGTVTLKGGQWIVINGLPVGTRYQVVENNADQNGYTMQSTGASGSISSTGDTAEFTNTNDTPPATTYTIEYYYDGVLDSAATETGNGFAEGNVTTYTDKSIANDLQYTLDRTENLPLELSADPSENVIRIYYVDGVGIPATYTVEYYYDGVKNAAATETVTDCVIGETITGYTDKPLYNNKRYTVNSVTGLPLQLTGTAATNVIKVYYTNGQSIPTTYTVEYYYDSVLDATATVSGSGNVGEEISTYTDKSVKGGLTYSLVSDNAPITLVETASSNVIRVYYGNGQQPLTSYTVEYYYDGVKDTAATDVITTSRVGDEISTYTAKPTKGGTTYNFDRVDGTPLTLTANTATNVIQVYYTSNGLATTYTVEYYYDGVQDITRTDVVNSTVGTTISTYTNKSVKNSLTYTLDSDNVPITLVLTAADNVIRVYYIDGLADPTTYTVEYYYDGVKDTAATDTFTDKRVGNTITTYTDKATKGSVTYNFQSANTPLTLTSTVSTNVVKVYYTSNGLATTYTVEYYYDGVQDTTRTDVVNSTVGTTISTYTSKSVKNSLTYTLDSDNVPITLVLTAADNVIRVYYIDGLADLTTYTVEYYYDNVQDTAATDTITTGRVGDIITTYTEKATKGSTTYNFVQAVGTPLTLTSTVADNVIKVYYTSVGLAATYTVEYYYDGVKATAATETYTDKLVGDQITTYLGKPIHNNLAYTVDSTDGLPLTLTLNTATNVIKVYYIDGQQIATVYTVEYYYDGVQDTTATETITDKFVGDTITTHTDKSIKGILQYTLDHVDTLPFTLTDTNANNVIKVYYINGQRIAATYTVEYYYDGALDNSKTDTFTDKFVGDIVSTYTDKQIRNNLRYTFDRTENLPLTLSLTTADNVIKVYFTNGVVIPTTYTVEYYYDGVLDSSLTDVLAGKNMGDVISAYTDKSIRNYLQFTLDHVDTIPFTLTETAANNVIKVYYVNGLAIATTYKVEYYFDRVLDSTMTETLNGIAGGRVTSIVMKNRAGYFLESVVGLPITLEVDAATNVIKVYYSTVPAITPKTGDSNTWLWSIPLVCSMLAVGLVLSKKKKSVQ